MLLLLLNLASQCWGQNQQLPTPSLQTPQSQQVVQNSLNQKFSVFGGTVTGNSYYLGTVTSSGGFVSNGNNTGGNDYCFHDGTCQNTASGSGTYSFGPSTYTAGSGVEVDSPVALGLFTLVWSTYVTGVVATTMSVTNVGDATYFFIWKATNTSSSTIDPSINFNTDTGSNYTYFGNCINTGASASPSSTSGSGILLGESGTNHIAATARWLSQGYIYIGDGTSWPTLNYTLTQNNVNTGYCTGGGWWKNISSVTQIVFKGTTGKWTGFLYVYKAINQNGI